MNWPTEKELKSFYGNPDTNGDGSPDVAWESANIVGIKPAYAMVLAWDTTRPVTRIRCHRLVAGSLSKILQEVGELGTDFIKKHELDHFGGAYNFRAKRGSPSLSVHSYGAAIDLSPARNAWKKKWDPKTMMPLEVVEIFEAHGWVFGGTWSTADAMHFQATGVSK